MSERKNTTSSFDVKLADASLTSPVNQGEIVNEKPWERTFLYTMSFAFAILSVGGCIAFVIEWGITPLDIVLVIVWLTMSVFSIWNSRLVIRWDPAKNSTERIVRILVILYILCRDAHPFGIMVLPIAENLDAINLFYVPLNASVRLLCPGAVGT